MGDIVGRLFREFAVTLAVAILISAVVFDAHAHDVRAYAQPATSRKQNRFSFGRRSDV